MKHTLDPEALLVLSDFCYVPTVPSSIFFKNFFKNIHLFTLIGGYELPDVQAGFRKGRGIRDQIANIRWIMDKAREFQKISIYVLLTMPKPLTVWITINCGKSFKRWEYQTT